MPIWTSPIPATALAAALDSHASMGRAPAFAQVEGLAAGDMPTVAPFLVAIFSKTLE